MEKGRSNLQSPERRRFLDYLIGGIFMITGGGILAAILAYLRPSKAFRATGAGRLQVASESDLKVGQGKLVPFRDIYILVIRAPEEFVAFSAICTHASCIVNWDEEKQQILCPCHDGVFDRQGNVVSGPPPRPLNPVTVEVLGGKVYVRGT